jgi:hypothetical protein
MYGSSSSFSSSRSVCEHQALASCSCAHRLVKLLDPSMWYKHSMVAATAAMVRRPVGMWQLSTMLCWFTPHACCNAKTSSLPSSRYQSIQPNLSSITIHPARRLGVGTRYIQHMFPLVDWQSSHSIAAVHPVPQLSRTTWNHCQQLLTQAVAAHAATTICPANHTLTFKNASAANLVCLNPLPQEPQGGSSGCSHNHLPSEPCTCLSYAAACKKACKKANATSLA